MSRKGNFLTASFELHAAIGNDPDTLAVEKTFKSATERVLRMNKTKEPIPTGSMHRKRGIDSTIEVEAIATVIDSDVLGIYYASEDKIRCYSILVNVMKVTQSAISNMKEYDESSCVAVLARSTELLIKSGEFEAVLKRSGSDGVDVLLLELAAIGSSTNLTDEVSIESYECDHDDIASVEFMGPIEFDCDYRTNRNESHMRKQDFKTHNVRVPRSPLSVKDFPVNPMFSSISVPYGMEQSSSLKQDDVMAVSLRGRRKRYVRFNPVVEVKHTLSRHDMTPRETFNYWFGEDETLTTRQLNELLKRLMANWTRKKEKEYRDFLAEHYGKEKWTRTTNEAGRSVHFVPLREN